jgi:glycosyltransferase involved in cell wall biosynthesis
VPVAASTAPAIREVCGDAAAALDPGDSAAWADWMRRLCEPGAERDGLIARGRARVARYSWDATARGHHDLLDRMTNG